MEDYTRDQAGAPKPRVGGTHAMVNAARGAANWIGTNVFPAGKPDTAPQSQPGVQGPTVASAGPVGLKAPEAPAAGPAANAAPASASVAPVASVPQISIPAPTAAKSMQVGMENSPSMSIPNMQTSIGYLKDQVAKPYNDMDFKGLNAMAGADHGKYWSPDQGPRPATAQPAQQAQPASAAPQAADPIRDQLRDNAQFLGRFSGYGERFEPIAAAQQHAQQALIQHEQGGAQVGLMNAQAASLDPSKQIGLMREVNRDPALRDLYLAGKGMPAGSAGPAPMAPGAQVNAGNFMQWAGQQDNQALAGVLNKPDQSLVDLLEGASQFPGAADPSHPNHQAIQAALGQRYADPSKWQAETTPTYIHPSQSIIPALARLGPAQRNYDREQRKLQLIKALGVSPR